MPRLLKFTRTSLWLARVPIAGKSCKITKKAGADETGLLALPTELILIITNFLDYEYRMMLSLSCRSLRRLLSGKLDLSLFRSDLATRVRCQQYLERDMPRYLSCQYCGKMFDWKRAKWANYFCPCRASRALTILDFGWLSPDAFVGEEMVNLILRANRQGKKHGIPIEALDFDKTLNLKWNHRIKKTSATARVVAGQLIRNARREIEVPDFRINEGLCNIILMFCRHYHMNVTQSLWQSLELVTGITTRRHRSTRRYRCYFCESEFFFEVECYPPDQITLKIESWTNFGTQYGKTLAQRQIFTCLPQRLDDVEVRARKLQELFRSGDAPETEG